MTIEEQEFKEYFLELIYSTTVEIINPSAIIYFYKNSHILISYHLVCDFVELSDKYIWFKLNSKFRFNYNYNKISILIKNILEEVLNWEDITLNKGKYRSIKYLKACNLLHN